MQIFLYALFYLTILLPSSDKSAINADAINNKSKTFNVLTWNCEGLKNSVFMIKTVLKSQKISFACLSEPQIYQCDISKICEYLEGEYCWHLNSADLHDQDLPLISSKAHGGTLMLWL